MPEMKSKLVGVTFEGRQDNVAELTEGQELLAIFEDNNPFDPNAILLFADAQKTKPVGYLKKELAADLRQQHTKGWAYKFFVEQITGQTKQVKGCNIKIEASLYPKDEQVSKVQETDKAIQ
jgi:single-stranded-DNA-specific exonuclease